LFSQFDAINQEENTRDKSRLEPAFHEHGDGQGLPGASGHFKKHPAAPGNQSVIGLLQAFNLVGTGLNFLPLKEKR